MASISPVGNKWPYRRVNTSRRDRSTQSTTTRRERWNLANKKGLSNGCLTSGQNAWICPSCQVNQLAWHKLKNTFILSTRDAHSILFAEFHVLVLSRTKNKCSASPHSSACLLHLCPLLYLPLYSLFLLFISSLVSPYSASSSLAAPCSLQ